MRALVVGGAGFLGANLVRRCLREPGAAVTVLDSLEPRLAATDQHLRELCDRIRFLHGSTTDPAAVAAAVRDQDVVFNCAGQSSHPLSLRDPLFDAELNCLGSLQLLEAVRRENPGAVVVFASSSTVIGRSGPGPVDEEHAERPLDIYSADKGVAEKYHRIYHRVHDLATVSLRFANLYGPYGKPGPEFGFVNHFFHQAWSGGEIQVFGTGEQTRNVMHVDDACESLLMASRDPRLRGEAFFAAHDEHPSVAEVARTIVEVLGRGTVRHVEWPDQRRRIEIESVEIRSDRFRALTGWRPSCGLREGLERTRAVVEKAAAR